MARSEGSRAPLALAAELTHEDQEVAMNRYAAVTAVALALGLASLGEAAQLLSPPYVFKPRGPGGAGTKAACVIRNAGTTPVTVDVSLVVNHEATPMFDFCHVNGQP